MLSIEVNENEEEIQDFFSRLGLAGKNDVDEKEYTSAKLKIDELLLEWVGCDATKRLANLIIDVSTNQKLDSSEDGADETLMLKSLPKNYQHQIDRSVSSQPPRSPTKKSPKKRTQADMLSTGQGTQPGLSQTASVEHSILLGSENDYSSSSRRARSNFDSIPVFYTPGQHVRLKGRGVDEDLLQSRFPDVDSFFKPYPNGIPVEKFVHITKRLCGVPSFFNLPLCKRLNALYGGGGDDLGNSLPKNKNQSIQQASLSSSMTIPIKIKFKSFQLFWKNEMEPYDRFERFFRIVKQPEVDYICKDDFVPYLQELLHFHPGLDFLESHEEFQRKYALTVIARIFFKVIHLLYYHRIFVYIFLFVSFYSF